MFTEAELQSSLLPSQSAHLYQKNVLDEERFAKLNGKLRYFIKVETKQPLILLSKELLY